VKFGVRVVLIDQLYAFWSLVPCCDVRYDFRVKTAVDSSILSFV